MLSFDTAQGRFHVRAAGLAIVDGCALIQQDPYEDLWVLPGGRVEWMEDAREALRRELLEELGAACEVGRLIWVAEHFFVYSSRQFHEVCFFFEIHVPDLRPGQATFMAREGEIEVECRWVPLTELRDYRLMPEFLIDRLSSLPKETEHIVFRDNK